MTKWTRIGRPMSGECGLVSSLKMTAVSAGQRSMTRPGLGSTEWGCGAGWARRTSSSPPAWTRSWTGEAWRLSHDALHITHKTHYRVVLAQLRWCELVSDVTFGALWMPMGRLDNVSHVIHLTHYLSPDPVFVSAGSPGGQPQQAWPTPLHAAHHIQVL